MLRVAVLLSWLLCLPWPAVAQPASCAGGTLTCKASTGNYADVLTMYNTMDDGDTGIIPLGSWTWQENASPAQRLTITTKGIHLRGDPAGQTTLLSAGSSCQDGNAILAITEDASHHVEISDITFGHAGGGCDSGTSAWYAIEVRSVSGGEPVRLHDNDCLPAQGCTRFVRFFVSRGLVYKNTWASTAWHGANGDYNNRQFVSCKGGPTWESVSTWGTLDATGRNHLYVEDNVMDAISEMLDADDNCRSVIRYNQNGGGKFGSHGLDSSPSGNRHTEVYKNVMTVPVFGSETYQGITNAAWAGGRGGSWYIHNNIVPNLPGTTPSWSATMYALTNVYSGKYWSCWGNSLNPLHGTAGTNDFAGAQYPAPRQVGLGWDGGSGSGHYTINGVSGYVIEGYRLWNNTGGSNANTLTVKQAGQNTTLCSAAGATGVDNITSYFQFNRDWFTSAPSGYHPCDADLDAAAAGLDCEYPHKLRHDQTPGGGGDVTPPLISSTNPGPESDTTASNGTATGTCFDAQGTCATSGSASNALNADTASVVVNGTVWAMTTIDYALGLNPVTIAIADNSGNGGTSVFTVFRDDCGSSLPYTNAFALYGDATAWTTPGPCFTQYGAGTRHVITGNKMTSTAATCEAYTGQTLSANQSSAGTIGTVAGSSGVRFMARMSGNPGQSDNLYGLFLQVAPTSVIIGRYNGAFGFDHVYANYTASIGAPVADTTTGRLEVANSTATGFVDLDGPGGSAEVQLSPSVDISQVVTNGAYPIVNGPPGICFTAAGRSVDDVAFAEVGAPPADDEDPVTTIDAPSDNSETTETEIAIGDLNGTCTDNTAPVSVEYENNRVPGFIGLPLSMGAWENSVAAVPLELGINVITVRCHDAADNVGEDTVTITRETADQDQGAQRIRFLRLAF